MSKRRQRRENRTGSPDFNPNNSRKHRRAFRRQAIKRTIRGTLYNAGEKVPDDLNNLAFTAGGSINYH